MRTKLFFQSFVITFLMLVLVMSATLAITSHALEVEQPLIEQLQEEPTEEPPALEQEQPDNEMQAGEVEQPSDLIPDDDISAIRLYLEVIIFVLIPLFLSVYIVFLLFRWFYHAFFTY